MGLLVGEVVRPLCQNARDSCCCWAPGCVLAPASPVCCLPSAALTALCLPLNASSRSVRASSWVQQQQGHAMHGLAGCCRRHERTHAGMTAHHNVHDV